MANATTQPTDKVLKIIGGDYGKGKRREDSVGGIGGSKKRNLKIHSVTIEVAISSIETFPLWEEARVSNCWYSREAN